MASRMQLIAVDGSDQAQHAFDWYLENFYREGDTVLLAHCMEMPQIHMGFLPGTQDVKTINEYCEAIKKQQDEVGSLIEHYSNILRQRKITFKVLQLTDGKPGEAIVKAAAKEGADHIVMGTRGLGTIRRTLLGSVSEYVIHHAECPCSIIRAPSASS